MLDLLLCNSDKLFPRYTASKTFCLGYKKFLEKVLENNNMILKDVTIAFPKIDCIRVVLFMKPLFY
jgi:hypothetical protein